MHFEANALLYSVAIGLTRKDGTLVPWEKRAEVDDCWNSTVGQGTSVYGTGFWKGARENTIVYSVANPINDARAAVALDTAVRLFAAFAAGVLDQESVALTITAGQFELIDRMGDDQLAQPAAVESVVS